MFAIKEEKNNDVNIWNQIADNYWVNRSSRQRWVNNHILYPELYNLLNYCDYDSILDYGCGDGSLCQYLLMNKVGCRLYAYDPCTAMANLAVKNIGPERVLEKTDGGNYDIIILNMVLQDVDDPCSTLELLSKILNKKGSVFLSIPHPVFSLIEERHQTTKRIYSESSKVGIYKYFEQGVDAVYWDNEFKIKTLHHHRTIETYIKYFRKTNFMVADISEPQPIISGRSEEDLYNLYSELPGCIIFKLQKRSDNI